MAKWGTALVTVAALALVASTPPAQAQPLPGTIGVQVDLKVERDGRLSVTETVTAPDGSTPQRVIRLRQPVGDDLDRVYEVSDARVDNGGRIDTGGDELTVHFQAGTSTLTYLVSGTVADVGDRQEVRWTATGGWDSELDTVSMTFVAPRPSASVTCFAGPVGSSTSCTLSQITDTQLTSAREVGLAAGDRVDLAVGLPAGTVPADVVLEETFSLARAFRLSPLTGLALIVLAVALAGGLTLLWRARGRDRAALALSGDGGDYQPLVRENGRVLFASPEGVLPGQIGTVVDEHVDVVDVTATIVDLAVRNYVWLAEEADTWRVVRRNPPDDALRPYERAVHDALFATDSETEDGVSLDDLRGRVDDHLTAVRDAMYGDVVSSGWFARRPDTDRSLAGRLGVAVAVAGVALTVVLAVFTTAALLGLAVIVAGVALVLGARHLPARTAAGSGLLGQLVVLRDYLHSVDVAALPAADRELVFSRSLPYAVVLGEARRWLDAFADLDPAADGTPGLYWYGGLDATDATDLRRFAARFQAFLTALDGALAEANHLRSLRRA